MELSKKISKKYDFDFDVSNSGLVAISISARCRSKSQTGKSMDEDLRIRLNGTDFRGVPLRKNIQLFNIPPAFNGSFLKGGKKTVVILTSLNKGQHRLSLIAKSSAFVEEIKTTEFSGKQDIEIEIQEKAEDCNNLPWYAFVLADLPLSYLSADFTIEKRFRDSDDVKAIIDGVIARNVSGRKFKYWYLVGGLLGWLFGKKIGEKRDDSIELSPELDSGIHYIEFWTDRMPVFRKIKLGLYHSENQPDARAADLVRTYSSVIEDASKEFGVDPILTGAMIYQEQSTNVNFVDTLTDYVGGLLHVNTSIGIGQVRVETARLLENVYPSLNPLDQNNDPWADSNTVRVERLKDPWTNARYVAAKIRFDKDKWNEAGFSLEKRHEIVGTLYNIEDIDSPIKPSEQAELNDFGIGVKENYDKVGKLLGI